MSTRSRIYSLRSQKLGEDLRNSGMNLYSGNKMDNKGCEVSRVRVCKPLKECHEVVTTKHVEQVACDDPCDMDHLHHGHGHGHGYSSVGWAVLWFIIIAVIVWLIIFSLKPAWALDEDGNVDTGKVLLASVVLALIIVIVVWIIYMACRGGWGHY